MFIIAKTFAFSASHQLTHLPATHQCARLHGHNYEVEVELRASDLDPATGFVRDYGDMAAIQAMLNNEFDHRHLNDVRGSSEETTAERLAAYLFGRITALGFSEVSAVTVRETPKTRATFRYQS